MNIEKKIQCEDCEDLYDIDDIFNVEEDTGYSGRIPYEYICNECLDEWEFSFEQEETENDLMYDFR